MLGENNELKNRQLRIDINTNINDDQSELLTVNESGPEIGFGGQKRWSEKAIKLLELIKGNPTITRKELSDALGINPSAVQKHIDKLKNEGIILREGSDKKGSWKVIVS